MTTYAVIDINSGYVWGVITANSPFEACAKLDAVTDPVPIGYSERGMEKYDPSTSSAYQLYHMDDVADDDHGLDAVDKEDPNVISMVEAHPLVATMTSRSPLSSRVISIDRAPMKDTLDADLIGLLLSAGNYPPCSEDQSLLRVAAFRLKRARAALDQAQRELETIKAIKPPRPPQSL